MKSMQKTFTLQNMETYFSNYISCNEHKKQPITNFCTENPCLKFLCPECIEIHSTTHSNHSIESIKTCIKKTSDRLKETIFALEAESNRNSFLKSENTEEYTKKLIRELQEVKQGLIEQIKAYFKQKQYEIRKYTSKYVQIQRKLQHLKRDLAKATSQLKTLQRNLLVPQQTVSAIMKANKLSFKGMIRHFHTRINEIEHEISLTIKLQMNSEKRQILRKSLNELVGIRSRKDQAMKKEGNYSYNEQKFVKESRKKENKYKLNQVNPPPLSADRILQQGSFRIDVGNFFVKNPFLHFLSVDNSTLHIINIQNIKENKYSKWEKIQLNIDFKLPAFHRTIATQNGNIYVIGGTNESQQNLKRSKAVFQFDAANKTLILVCEMKVARSSHSVVCHRGLIYIAGGISDNDEILKKCQVFNPKTRQIKLIASCQNATRNSCLCFMGNDQLIKLGGVFSNGQNNDTIEVYSIRNDVWQAVDPTIQQINGEFGLLSCSGWAPLNQNQIFIFGGYDEQSDNSNSKMSFVLQQNKQNNQFQIKYINQKNPPFAEGFWNQQGICHNGEIYCLQNMDGLVEEECMEDRKHLLIFNGKTWMNFLDQ